jgi:hypothetical protein
VGMRLARSFGRDPALRIAEDLLQLEQLLKR